MSAGGKYASATKKLPDSVAILRNIVQGLAIHEYVASAFYGIEIPEQRGEETHLRRLRQMLDAILRLDRQPLKVPRPPERRLVGVCHHFAVLLVGILRSKGVPARVRYGFGDYFNRGFFEDHSLCEYWNAKKRRWILVDPQFDAVWRKNLRIKHNVLDVPRTHFLVAADAWTRCRAGEADPRKFGIFKGDFRGLWFVAGNLIKDIAALNKVEMLQWDVWGAMPRPSNKLKDKKRLTFFDELAALSHDPDSSFRELRKRYRDESQGLQVPGKVFNGRRRRLEIP
jgi:hypothetical protein